MAFTVAKNAWCKNVHSGIRFKKVCAPGNGIAAFAIDEYDRLWSWAESTNGSSSQGDPEIISQSPLDMNYWDRYYTVSPKPVATNTGEYKRDWVKVMQGENSTMAMDKSGRLWGCGSVQVKSYNYGNCAAFGLPNNSGVHIYEWRDGPTETWRSNFFNLTRAAPDFTVKDFMHNMYFTQMIGQDDLFYFMGWEYGNSFSGGSFMGFTEAYWEEPTLSPYLTDTPIKKILATGSFGSLGGVVTKDNRVLICGDDVGSFDAAYDPDVEYVIDVTGNLPDIEIIDLAGDYEGMLVLLANGDVYGRGEAYTIGQGLSGVDSYDAWVQVPVLSNITKIGISQTSPWAIDFNGFLYTWGGFNSYEDGDQCNYHEDFPAIATRHKRWKDVTFNYYNNAYQGVDVEGRLWAWGSQYWSPQLGIGTTYWQSVNDELGIELATVRESCRPVRCDVPFDTMSFHWPRAVPTPTPDYYER